MAKNILIKNVYYMLCYAYSNLSSTIDENVDVEEFDNIQDLLARILYKGLSVQVKRGLYKEYEEQTEVLNCIKGKINISESIKQNTLYDKKLVCEFEEFTKNSYFNKVIKSTIELLLNRSDINIENRKLLKKILIYFYDVETVDIKRVKWNGLQYHKNNISYKLILNICYLIIEGLLMKESCGNVRLNKYLDDKEMHKLFEKFVLEYYKTHYPNLNPASKVINWDTDYIDFLPKMLSDIMLFCQDKTLIIDTKFYNNALQTYYDKESYRNNNLNQIFTYVQNHDKDRTGNVSGILLYAKTKHEVIKETERIIHGNKIGVKFVDLNKDFECIKEKLNTIVEKFIQ